MNKFTNEIKKVKGGKKFYAMLFGFAILFLLSLSITYAYFSSTAKINGITFSFAKIDTAMSIDNGTTFSKGIDLSLSELFSGANVTSATVIAQSVAVKVASNSIGGYLRIKAPYSGTDDASQKLSIVLNSQFFNKATYANASYKWQKYNGFYYLVKATDGTLYECNANDALNTNGGYKLFDSNLYFPDLTQYDIEGIITSDTLTKVHFELKAEAMQSTNVKATTVSDLHTIINENQIFNDYTNLGFVLEYETFGGEAVKGQIITNEDVTLPKVGGENGTSVEWYSGYANGTYSNLVGSSGAVLSKTSINANMKLYAKYPSSTNFYVYFESNGATIFEGLSSPQTVAYADSGNVTFTFTQIEKTGYTLSGFAVKGDSTKAVTYNSTNKTITIAKNVQKAGKAITIIPIWTSNNYTATFLVNGGSISSADISALGLSGNASSGYNKTYTTATNLTFPASTKTDCILLGWQVTSESNGLGDIKWRKGDIYISGEIANGYFGNVTFTALYSTFKFSQSSVSKYLGESNFTNPLTNATGQDCTFSSSNTNVATVNVKTGEVTIKGIGTTTITATNAFGSVSYLLTVTQIIVTKPQVTSTTTFTYDGNQKTITLSSTSSNFTISGTQSATNAGSYSFTIALNNKSIMKWNDNTTADITVNWTISKATMSATVSGKTATYNGSAHYATAKMTTPSSATISYGSSTSYGNTLTLSTTDKNLDKMGITDVGSITVYYKITASNYNDITGNVVVTINKATMSATVSGKTATYNGSARYATAKMTTPTSATISYGSSTSNYAYSQTLTTTSANLSSMGRADAGTTTIYYKITATNYEDKTGSVTVKVNKASFSPTLSFSSYNYGSSPTYSVSNNKSGGTVTYKYSSSSNGTYTNFTPSATALSIGTWYVKAVIAETTNYNLVETKVVKVVVSKKAGYLELSSTTTWFYYNVSYVETKKINIISSHGSEFTYSISSSTNSSLTQYFTVSIANNIITITKGDTYNVATESDIVTIKITCSATSNYYSASVSITIDFSEQTCFVAGTKITMADGSLKNIEDIVEGDKVLSYDEISGEIVEAEVGYRTINIYVKNMAILTFSDGSTVNVTAGHAWLTKNGWHSIENAGGYDTMVVGDEIKTVDGWKTLTNIEIYVPTEPVTIYNLHIKDSEDGRYCHNYFAEGGCAHNIVSAV